MTDPLPEETRAPAVPPEPPAEGLGPVGKIVLWGLAAIIVVPIVIVALTFLSIFFIGYNR